MFFFPLFPHFSFRVARGYFCRFFYVSLPFPAGVVYLGFFRADGCPFWWKSKHFFSFFPFGRVRGFLFFFFFAKKHAVPPFFFLINGRHFSFYCRCLSSLGTPFFSWRGPKPFYLTGQSSLFPIFFILPKGPSFCGTTLSHDGGKASRLCLQASVIDSLSPRRQVFFREWQAGLLFLIFAPSSLLRHNRF